MRKDTPKVGWVNSVRPPRGESRAVYSADYLPRSAKTQASTRLVYLMCGEIVKPSGYESDSRPLAGVCQFRKAQSPAFASECRSDVTSLILEVCCIDFLGYLLLWLRWLGLSTLFLYWFTTYQWFNTLQLALAHTKIHMTLVSKDWANTNTPACH